MARAPASSTPLSRNCTCRCTGTQAFSDPEEGIRQGTSRTWGAGSPRTTPAATRRTQELRLRNRFQQGHPVLRRLPVPAGHPGGEPGKGGAAPSARPPGKEARKAVSWPHLMEDLPRRFQRLGALGLDERLEPGGVYVTSTDFPKMLYGCGRCARPRTTSTGTWTSSGWTTPPLWREVPVWRGSCGC